MNGFRSSMTPGMARNPGARGALEGVTHVKAPLRFLFAAALIAGAAGMLAPRAFAQDAPQTVEAAPAAENAPAEPPEAAAPPADAPEAGAGAEAGAADGAAAPGKKKNWFRGSVSGGFDGMWSGGDGGHDVDLDQSLQFQMDPPNCERLHLRGAFWLIEDLGSSSGHGTLNDIDDAFNEGVIARVSHLYMDVDDLWKDSTLRVGRQRIMEGAEYNRIDGVYFKQRLDAWEWYVFGGTRATFYDDDFDDPAAGGGVSYSPTGRTKIALDGYYGSEKRFVAESRTFHGPVAALVYRLGEDDDLKSVDTGSVALSLWQTVSENLSLYGRVDWHDDEGEELLLSATGYVPGPFDLTYEATYRRQFNSITDRMNDATGYYRLMGVYEEYDNLFLALYRPVTKQVTVSLEAEFHQSENDNWSNRDYQRYAAVVSGEKLFGGAALDARAGVEFWEADQGGGSWAVVGEVGRRWNNLELALGTDYQRYEDRVVEYNETLKLIDMARVWFAPGILQGYNPLLLFFDHYAVEMHENIYTVYLKAKWSVTADQDLSAKVTYEEGDGPHTPVWRVQADYTFRF